MTDMTTAELLAEISDPNSDFNIQALLRDRATSALGLSNAETREIIGDAILRAYLLGQGRSKDEVLGDDPDLDNVLPMPGVDVERAAAENVVPLPVVTYISHPAETILKRALASNLEEVIVIGWQRDKDFYFAGNHSSGPENLWLLKIAEKRLLAIGDPDRADASNPERGA